MKQLDAVDVGIKYHARACFRNGELYSAQLVSDVEPLEAPWASLEWRLVIECATVRQRDGATKKKEVDALNRAAGRIGANHHSPEFLLPEQWKGQTPKKVDQARTLRKLTKSELLCLPKKKAELLHVLDAVGLGLHALGR